MTRGLAARRILLVINALGRAGAETQLYHLAEGLSEAGHAVTLLAIAGAERETRSLEESGIEVVTLDAGSRPEKLAKTFEIARYARRADVVHCTGWDATLWGRIGAIMARRPVVITEHTPGRSLQVKRNGASRERIIALHNRLLDRGTYATIAVGAWQIDLLVGEGVRRESIVHIPNAVPVATLRQKAQLGPTRETLGIPAESFVVIQIARFFSQKGQMTTLRTVSRLREEQGGDVRAVFVGKGPEEDSIRREATRIGADWAMFLGGRNDVPGLLRLADLCVLPSTGEGLPMSLIEAVAIGTPIVATDVGDVRWLVETTGSGICVPPGDDREFTEACCRLLADPALRGRLSAAAARAARDFDAPKMTRGYEQVFDAAVESSPLPLVLTE